MAELTPRTIVVVGPPGSGKGTQAELLAERLKWPHIDVGQLLREAARDDSDEARRIKSAMLAGKMLPADLVEPVVTRALTNQSDGCVLDGYARQRDQVDSLLGLAKRRLVPPLLGIRLVVPVDELLDRLRQRRYCVDCHHKSYLVTTAREAVTCLRCGGHLDRRTDDDEKIIERRLNTFKSETVPALTYLAQHIPMIDVDGRGSIAAIQAEIWKKLRKHET